MTVAGGNKDLQKETNKQARCLLLPPFCCFCSQDGKVADELGTEGRSALRPRLIVLLVALLPVVLVRGDLDNRVIAFQSTRLTPVVFCWRKCPVASLSMLIWLSG